MCSMNQCFSKNKKKYQTSSSKNYYFYSLYENRCILHRHVFVGLTFLILGLWIFFQNIKVGGGKKIKIKITKKCFI